MHAHNLRVTPIMTLCHNDDKIDAAQNLVWVGEQKHESIKQWPEKYLGSLKGSKDLVCSISSLYMHSWNNSTTNGCIAFKLIQQVLPLVRNNLSVETILEN